MNEAGLASARVAPAEEEASVLSSRPLEEVVRAPARANSRRWLLVLAQAGVALGATAIAFWASLISLEAGFPGHLALGALGLVPLISLLLAAAIAIRRQRPEPAIHDRYLDYILGLALLGAATAAMWFLPRSMSIFFWSWRLDLVWLPFFAAGAVTLVCGVRAVWRYRLPIVFLLLAWPLPYVVARIPGPVAAVAILGLGLIVLAVQLSLPRLAVRLPPPRAWEGRGGGVRVGGGLVAAALVCGAAILTTVADRQLEAAGPLLAADGQPRLAATSKPASMVDGLSRTDDSSIPRPQGMVGWGPSSHAYHYAGAQASLPGTGVAGDAGIVVDVLAPADGRGLALSPLTVATLQGYRLEASRVVDIGGGVAAHVDRYLAPVGTVSLLAVWWDWPVRSPAGSRPERVIVQRLVALGAADGNLLGFARAIAASMIHEAAAAS